MISNTKINERMKIVITIFLIWSICLYVCIIDAFFAPVKYTWLFLLPLSFAICATMFINLLFSIRYSLVSLILIAMMFLKNVVIPFFMGKGSGKFPAVVDTDNYMLGAIGLEIYEEIVVFLIVYIFAKRVKRETYSAKTQNLTFNKDYVIKLNIVTVMFVFTTLVLILRYPILTQYFTIGILGDADQNIQKSILQNEMIRRVPSVVYYLFSVIANFVRWAIPLCVMFSCYVSKKGCELRKIVSCVLVILLSAIVTNDTVATSFFIIISMGYILIKLFPTYRRSLMLMGVGGIVVIGFFALIVKTYGNSSSAADFTKIANMLQAYFSGPDNVAVALSIENSITFEEMIGNIFRFIPYIMHYFLQYTTSTIEFNAQYWGNESLTNQIIPMISQGARTFSVIFAPLYTALVSYIAMKAEIKARTKNDLFDFAIYVIWGVCFAMAVGMYSASLCIQLFLNYVFILMIIKWFSKKFFVK